MAVLTPREECFVYQAFKRGAVFRIVDEVFWRKDGTPFPVEYTSSPLFEGETVVGAVVTFKDISAQKYIEGERETLLAELENMNIELKNFAHVVSHDLKEPLRGINYNAQWLQDEFGEVLEEKGKKFLNRLTHNTDRMYSLINDILQFAEVGNTEELSVPVSSGELVESVVRVLAPQENIEIEIQQPMPEVGYPPVRLKQIFQNLIVNGVRHFGKPTGKIMVSCASQNQYWCFKVWDNGQGIHEKHFSRIFEMFQSLDRKESPDSTGIGLALVKKIVEQNGGEIQVESEFGEYTCFSFTVPKMVEKGRRNDA
ncbi:MAG: PAS domain-containing protein [Nitrospina sp.]|jgi:two-component system, LuxR family, sensor kinase FixL|nr:PAS domain-containing protein [Nitrospina sp.]